LKELEKNERTDDNGGFPVYFDFDSSFHGSVAIFAESDRHNSRNNRHRQYHINYVAIVSTIVVYRDSNRNIHICKTIARTGRIG